MQNKKRPSEAIILKKIGENIAKYRKQKNISQEELGDISGIDRTYISSVERGKRNISAINICKIARSLSKEPGDILEGVFYDDN